MIISNAMVKRAGPKLVIQCVLNAWQHVGNQVTGLATPVTPRAKYVLQRSPVLITIYFKIATVSGKPSPSN